MPVTHLKSIYIYCLSANPFSDTYRRAIETPVITPKFISCKTLFFSVSQTVTGIYTYSV
jgi:hypothetical protein